MPRIVVVGSTNTDMTVSVPRIPAAGETILGSEFRVTAGGKGANQAVAAARGGGSVILVTALGTDDFGDRALESFRREGVNIDFIRRVPDAPSGVALICVAEGGENCIAVAPGANARLHEDDLAPLREVVAAEDVLLLQLEIPLSTVEAAARIAAARGARVILNPAPARALPDSLLAGVSLLTPNEAEAEHLTGAAVDDRDALGRAAARLHGRGVDTVLVTLGGRGVFVSGPEGSELVPAFDVHAVDTTGAGDVFNGALAVALAEGRPLRDAALFASAAGALSVTRPGAQASAPSRRDIEQFLLERTA